MCIFDLNFRIIKATKALSVLSALRGVQETQSLLQESNAGDRTDPQQLHSRLGSRPASSIFSRLSRLRLVSSRWQRVIFHCHCHCLCLWLCCGFCLRRGLMMLGAVFSRSSGDDSIAFQRAFGTQIR